MQNICAELNKIKNCKSPNLLCNPCSKIACWFLAGTLHNIAHLFSTLMYAHLFSTLISAL